MDDRVRLCLRRADENGVKFETSVAALHTTRGGETPARLAPPLCFRAPGTRLPGPPLSRPLPRSFFSPARERLRPSFPPPTVTAPNSD